VVRLTAEGTIMDQNDGRKESGEFKREPVQTSSEEARVEVEFRPIKTALRENVEAVVVALILALLVRTFIFQAFKIPSGSMRDTLLEGDHILVNKFIYSSPMPYLNISLFPLKKPEHKDILVFKYPNNPQKDYIKRCIAISGDTLIIRNHDVWLNDVKQDEQRYVRLEQFTLQSYQDRYWQNFTLGPKVIPPSQYFMMGDNRDNSQDSRVWGMLDGSLIKGKAFLIYLSIEDKKGPIWERIRWKRFFNRIL
jgi:signal peptidase I